MYPCRYIAVATLCLVPALAAAPPQVPNLRLNRDVQPERIRLDLTLSPEKTDFSGKVQIELVINNAVDHFWLNATDLSVSQAKLETNGQTLEATIVPGGTDFVGFQFASTLQPGKAHFSLSYTGKVNLRSSAGIFRSKNDQDSYLFTQFEAIDARRAFPCFDEPDFKIPWQLTLHVPSSDVAVANTKVESETPEDNGLKAVRFTETKPLPSYLIAFGVGPLEFVDAGTAGSHHVPVRIVVPRGDTDRAKYAASISAEILTRLENYFGVPYPYDKSDQLAIPLSFGGAMENPGLVTYDANIILSPPGQESVRFERGYASVAAHELAHQWTGDMVTMKWWNDTWLNESFATWMSAKLLSEWKPEWQTRAQDERARLLAINVDTRTSARRINQPVESKSDIGNAFDGITYQKGGSVLAMFENAVGPSNFQRVMHNYLNAHMFGNATAEDFLAELGRDTKPEYASAFATFLNQTGVPEVKAHLNCAKGQSAAVQLEQQRLLPLGSTGDTNRTWNVPFCIAYSFGQGRKEICKLITQQKTTWTLPEKGCPAWLLGNDKEVGYYEAAYDPNMLGNLLNHRNDLTLAEQVGALGDLDVLARDGQIPWDEILGLVPRLKDDTHPEILEAAVRLASVPQQYIDADVKTNYAAYIEDMFGVRARQLGWQPKPTDTPEEKLLRPQLVGFVANRGEDSQLVEEAKHLANVWLDDHGTLAPDVAGTVLAVAARNSDSIFYDKVLVAAKAEHDPFFKPMLIAALGDFQDPNLVRRSIAMTFDGTFDLRMSMRMFGGAAENPKIAELPYAYIKEHYDQVVSKLPSSIGTDYAARLPGLAAAAECSDQAADRAKAFFEPRMAKVIGGPRSLSNALEQIHLCAAAKPGATEQITKFLSTYPAKSATAAGGQ